MKSLEGLFEAQRPEYLSPLVIDLGEITKVTLGSPCSQIDCNVCPGPNEVPNGPP